MKYANYLMVYDQGGIPHEPTKKYTGDAGWDLYASREITIQPGDTQDVHTDIKVNIPPFTFARIIGRSSTMRNLNLLVTEAIIDNGYTGEMFISVHNVGTKPFHVEVGMRLAQVIFHKIEDIRWTEVDAEHFIEGERGEKGFGSTGLHEII